MEDKYCDKHGVVIKVGMTLKHDDGDLERVYESVSGDLGFNATNEKWVGYMEGYNDKLYPLYQFNLKEWEIVK